MWVLRFTFIRIIFFSGLCEAWFQHIHNSYLVDLPGCLIPESPLYPDEVKYYWHHHFRPWCPALPKVGVISSDHVNCDLRSTLRKSVQSCRVLTLDPAVVISRNVSECCYKEIQRPYEMRHDKYVLSKCMVISESTEADISAVEYLFINCTTTNGTKAKHFLEFHHNIPSTKPEIEEKLEYWADKADEEKPMSIMHVIIDSVSRAHALRSLPKTMQYLTDTAGFVDFKGYHCVGEPSSTNYIPMTLGIIRQDINKIRHPDGRYDDEPFIHKNFSRSNYLTMQMEDMPYYNVFNFNGRSGFYYKPFDFYLRPYLLTLYDASRPRHCVNDRLVYDFMLDYTLEFVETYLNVPKYTTTYVTWPNHDKFIGTRVMDDSFLNYFQKLEQMGAFNNTIVFVVADHGFRFNLGYAESRFGLLERSLPMFLVKLPQPFIKKYPEMYAHLVNNSEKITSHLDMFRTLTHLHQLVLGKEEQANSSYGYKMEYGRSLLKEIPANRTCEDARIPERFCSCNFPLFEPEFDYEKHKKYNRG